jgi:hypothetical protein
MDKLKEFIAAHRNEMDVDLPTDKVWRNIEKAGQEKRKGRVVPMRWLSAAAASVCLVIGLYFLFPRHTEPTIAMVDKVINDTTKQPAKTPVIDSADDDPHVPILPMAKAERRIKSTTEERTVEKEPATAGQVAKVEEPSVAEVFHQVQQSYGRMVSNELEAVRNTPVYGEDAESFSLFKRQFDDLQREEDQIAQDYKNNGQLSEQIDRTITVYQEKIKLLKQLQSEIKKVNNKTKNRVPLAKDKPSYINI